MWEDLRIVNALTTRPRCIWCYELKMWDHGYTRVAVWGGQKHSQPVGSLLNEWTNQDASSRHASPSSVNQVSDARALAPVVFSGDGGSQTCKIRKFKAKGRPSPPISTLLNPMVASFRPKNGCIMSFDEENENCPNNGSLNSGKHELHVTTQTWSLTPQELIMMVRFKQNTMEIKKRIQVMYAYVWSYRARFRLFHPLFFM